MSYSSGTGPIQVAAVSSGATQLAYAGPASILGRGDAAALDLRMIASFTNRLTYTMIARPELKKAEDLRGKRFGVQAIGGSVWMGAVLGLEYPRTRSTARQHQYSKYRRSNCVGPGDGVRHDRCNRA